MSLNPHVLLKEEKQIASVESIQRVDDAGHLYYMESTWDYYHPSPEMIPLISAGCSVFLTQNLAGETLLCRNYDYSHFLHNDKSNPRTGINVIVRSHIPGVKYGSIGVADAFWIDRVNASIVEGYADDGTSDISAFAICPYLCMDGMNEAGFGVSILALGTEAEWTETDFDTWKEQAEKSGKKTTMLKNPGDVPSVTDSRTESGALAVNEADQKAWICDRHSVWQKAPGKQTVYHPVLMRFMLDQCATVEEAIALTDKFNLRSPMKEFDYHIFLADASGKSVILEWQHNEMIVTEVKHATNYYVCREDKMGGGKERDHCLEAALQRFPLGMKEPVARAVLEVVAQDPESRILDPESADGNRGEGKTQYSTIYNLTTKELKIWSFGDFEKNWKYTL